MWPLNVRIGTLPLSAQWVDTFWRDWRIWLWQQSRHCKRCWLNHVKHTKRWIRWHVACCHESTAWLGLCYIRRHCLGSGASRRPEACGLHDGFLREWPCCWRLAWCPTVAPLQRVTVPQWVSGSCDISTSLADVVWPYLIQKSELRSTPSWSVATSIEEGFSFCYSNRLIQSLSAT